MAVQAITRKTYLNLLTDAIREAGIQQKAPTSITDTDGLTPRFKEWMNQAYVELQLEKHWGWRRKRTELHLAPGSRRLFTRDRHCVRVLRYDDSATTFTDYTSESKYADTNDVLPFPTVSAEEAGDYIAFGAEDPFSSLHINVGTAGVGTWTYTWEYWDGSAWTALTGVSDGTSGFTSAGVGKVNWTTSPTDWAAQALNSTENLFYIRARISAYTSTTTDPLITQVQIDGTEDYEAIIHHKTDNTGHGNPYLSIRTPDNKSDVNVIDDDAIGKVYYMPYNEWRGVEDRMFSVTANIPSHYTILPDGRLEFNKPADDDYALDVDFMAAIKEMTADADYPDLPKELQDILVWRCVLNYMGWDEAAAGYGRAFGRYKFYLKRMQKDWLPKPTLRPVSLFINFD